MSVNAIVGWIGLAALLFYSLSRCFLFALPFVLKIENVTSRQKCCYHSSMKRSARRRCTKACEMAKLEFICNDVYQTNRQFELACRVHSFENMPVKRRGITHIDLYNTFNFSSKNQINGNIFKIEH